MNYMKKILHKYVQKDTRSLALYMNEHNSIIIIIYKTNFDYLYNSILFVLLLNQ